MTHKQSFHEGVDYPIATGTRVQAIMRGLVVRSDFSTSFGNVIIINHGTDPKGNTIFSLYAHNSSLSVSRNTRVHSGQQIALSDSTGEATTGPHLHFEIHVMPPGTPDLEVVSMNSKTLETLKDLFFRASHVRS